MSTPRPIAAEVETSVYEPSSGDGAPDGVKTRYFDEGTFVPARLAVDITGNHPIIKKGPDGALWEKVDGIWRAGGDEKLAYEVRKRLGEHFRKNRLTETRAYVEAAGTLPVEPPPDSPISVANGLLDLDTLELREPTQDEIFFYRIPVRWNPDAKCPKIDKFLLEVLSEDEALVKFLWDAIGATIIPSGRYRRAVMLQGEGDNGKSKILGLLRALIGEENTSNVTLQDLVEGRFARAELFGKLANIAGDLDARPVARSDTFKMTTGDDVITAERKFGQPFSFKNYATLIFSANEWPATYDQGGAYFKRWLAIPLRQKYVEGDRPLEDGERRADPNILEKLTTRTELEGALVKAVEGARRVRNRGGFAPPEPVEKAVAEYRRWADSVQAWTEEKVTQQEGAKHTRSYVYTSYRDWCRDEGGYPVSAKRFWPRLRELVDFKEKRADTREVIGIKVEP